MSVFIEQITSYLAHRLLCVRNIKLVRVQMRLSFKKVCPINLDTKRKKKMIGGRGQGGGRCGRDLSHEWLQQILAFFFYILRNGIRFSEMRLMSVKGNVQPIVLSISLINLVSNHNPFHYSQTYI